MGAPAVAAQSLEPEPAVVEHQEEKLAPGTAGGRAGCEPGSLAAQLLGGQRETLRMAGVQPVPVRLRGPVQPQDTN